MAVCYIAPWLNDHYATWFFGAGRAALMRHPCYTDEETTAALQRVHDVIVERLIAALLW